MVCEQKTMLYSYTQYSIILLILTGFAEMRSPAGNYMLKVNNRNTITRCEICSKLTIKTPERGQWLVLNLVQRCAQTLSLTFFWCFDC